MGTDVRSFFEKDFLGSWNIPESGELTITITKCVQGALNQPGSNKKTKKPVIFMEGTEKGFALNATNTKTIAGLYGYMVENWPGKRITLYKSMTRNPAGGDDVECLRVRPKVPAADSAAASRKPLTPEERVAKTIATFAALGVDEQKLRSKLGKDIPEASKAELEAAYASFEMPVENAFGDAAI